MFNAGVTLQMSTSDIVLKEGHCLKGKDVLPVVMLLGQLQEEGPPASLARLTKKHKLGSYEEAELREEFLKLTGYPVANILKLAGVPDTGKDALMMATHAAIIEANTAGGPVEQGLQVAAAASASTKKVTVAIYKIRVATSMDNTLCQSLGCIDPLHVFCSDLLVCKDYCSVQFLSFLYAVHQLYVRILECYSLES